MNMTAAELVTELSMTYSCKMHLILEGDDDRKFFQAVLRGREKINMLCAWDADKVIGVIEEVDKLQVNAKFAPTLGVIDRDYRIPLGKLPCSTNIIISDARDFECMMFDSPSLESVFAEFGSSEKITALGGPSNIAGLVREAGALVGSLRFYSQRAGLGVSFKELDLERIIDKKTLSINKEELVRHLNARQRATGASLPNTAINLAKEVCAAARCNQGCQYFNCNLLLCRGHDLMEILAIGFRSLFGTRSAAESSRKNVESLFRLSYVAHFKATSMAKSLERWLSSNGIQSHISLV